jgi:hypothetical protein
MRPGAHVVIRTVLAGAMAWTLGLAVSSCASPPKISQPVNELVPIPLQIHPRLQSFRLQKSRRSEVEEFYGVNLIEPIAIDRLAEIDRWAGGVYGAFVGLKQEVTNYSTQLAEDAWRLLQWGSVVFSAPARIVLEHSESVSVAVSSKLSPAELEAVLGEELRDSIGDNVKISNRMRAELIGPAFTIVPLALEEQVVRTDEPTHWRWTVTPTRSGDQSLHLNVYAVLKIPDIGKDEGLPIIIKTYDKKIAIDLGILQRVASFLRKHWQWIFASLLYPVLKFIVGRIGKGGGSAGPPNLRFGQRLSRRRGLA